MKMACLFIAALAVTSAASGAIAARWTDDPTVEMERGIVALVNRDGTVAGWRGRIYSPEGEYDPPGSTGLNQVTLEGQPTPSLETAQYLDERGRGEDTHFLFLDSQIIVHHPLTEGRIEQPDGAFMTELSGDFEIKPEFAASVVPLAQVAYVGVSYIGIQGWAIDGEGQEHWIWKNLVITPEPASAALLVGCVTLLALRKRRRPLL